MGIIYKENLSFCIYVNAKMPRLGSIAAKVKLKQIGGSLF